MGFSQYFELVCQAISAAIPSENLSLTGGTGCPCRKDSDEALGAVLPYLGAPASESREVGQQNSKFHFYGHHGRYIMI
jgi:hypothetical protein